MANGFMDTLGDVGNLIGRAYMGRLSGSNNPFIAEYFQDRLLDQQAEQMQPLREAVQQYTTGQQAFQGGPRGEQLSPREMMNNPLTQIVQGGGPSAGGQAGGMPQRQQQSRPEQAVDPRAALQVTGESQQANPFAALGGTMPTQGQGGQLPQGLQPPQEIDSVLQQAASEHGVPTNALRALAAQESSFNPQAVNEATPGDPNDPGAVGLFQFTEATAQQEGIDPTNPRQAADATARMLRRRLDQGESLEDAMTAHFGGDNRDAWGENTQRYRQDVMQKFQQYEQAMPEGQQGGQQGQLRMDGSQIPRGPFGTALSPSRAQQNPADRLLAAAAADPRQFAETFAGAEGMEQLMGMMSGPEAEEFTLSPGETRFRGQQEIASVPDRSGQTRTRVYGGDSTIGQQLGLQPGERARVEEEFNDQGNIVNRNVQGGFSGGSGQNINVNLGADEYAEANAGTIDAEMTRYLERGANAQEMQTNLQQASDILRGGLNTGRGQAMLLPIRQLAQDFGVPLEETAQAIGIDLRGSRLQDQEEFDRLSRQVIIDGFDKFKGNLNTSEVDLAINAFNNLGRSEEANQRAVAALQASSDLAIERRREALERGTDIEGARQFLVDRSSKDTSAFNERYESHLERIRNQGEAGSGSQSQGGAPQAQGGQAQPGGDQAGGQMTRQDAEAALPQGAQLGQRLNDGRWEVVGEDEQGRPSVIGHIEP